MNNLKHFNRLPLEKQRYLLNMLPTHLANAFQVDRLQTLLTDFEFMETKVMALGPQPLIDDYQLSGDRTLHIIQNALRKEAHMLVERPDLLWQQLYNRLQWESEPIPQMLITQMKYRGVPSTRPWLRMHQSLPESSALLRTFIGHTDSVNACAISPDNSTIVSASRDHTLKLWDTRTGQIRNTLQGHTDYVTSCAFSPNGATIASASADNSLKLWDAMTGQQLGTLQGDLDDISACAWSPDGATIVSAQGDIIHKGRGFITGSSFSLKLWNAHTGQLQCTLWTHNSRIYDCAWSPDGSAVVSATWGELTVLDVTTGNKRTTLKHHSSVVAACAWSPDGSTIVSGSWDNTLKLWNARTGKRLAVLKGHTDNINGCAWSPDSSTIVSASADGTLKLWDAKTGQQLATLLGHTGPVTACAWSRDGSSIISASIDRTFKLWDVSDCHAQVSSRSDPNWIKACAFSPDGSIVVSGDHDGNLILWDGVTGEIRGTIRTGHTREITACTWSPDGSTIVSGSWDNTLKLWNARTGKRLATLNLKRLSEGGVRACAFSPDGSSIVSGSEFYDVRMWDVTERYKSSRFALERISACTFGPNGDTLLTAGLYGDITLWDICTGRKLFVVRHGSPFVRDCAFHPAGTAILSSGGSVVKLWDAVEAQRLFEAVHHEYGEIDYEALTEEEVEEIWHQQSKQLDRELESTKASLRLSLHHNAEVTACAFSPDGAIIYSVSREGTLKVWDAQTGRELAILSLLGNLECLAAHPYLEKIVVGSGIGKSHLLMLDLVGISYGPVIITAIDYGTGPVVRCPKCAHKIILNVSLLGHKITCPQVGCTARMQINTFLVTAKLRQNRD